MRAHRCGRARGARGGIARRCGAFLLALACGGSMLAFACGERPKPAAPPIASQSSVAATLLEDFESTEIGAVAWAADPHADAGPWGDEGAYHARRGVHAPPAFRASVRFGKGGWQDNLSLHYCGRQGNRILRRLY